MPPENGNGEVLLVPHKAYQIERHLTERLESHNVRVAILC